MAKEEVAAEAVSPRKSKKLLIIIIAVLVLAIAGGAAAFMLLGGKNKKGHEKEKVAHEEVEHAKTVLVPFEEKFTVNIQSDDGSAHYLQVPKVELEVASEDVAKNVHQVEIGRNDQVPDKLSIFEQFDRPHGNLGCTTGKVEQPNTKIASESLIDDLHRGHAAPHDAILAGKIVTLNAGSLSCVSLIGRIGFAAYPF